MTRYILKWWMPVLADWIKVGEYKTLRGAQDAEDIFRKKMDEYWKSPLNIVIVEVQEREL